MARWAVCLCGEGGSISVQGADDTHSRMFGRGSWVDLDEVIVEKTGQTMGDALGRYMYLFEVEVDVALELNINEDFHSPSSVRRGYRA